MTLILSYRIGINFAQAKLLIQELSFIIENKIRWYNSGNVIKMTVVLIVVG